MAVNSRFDEETMNALTQIWGVRDLSETTPEDPRLAMSYLVIKPPGSEVVVTDDVAFQVDAVWACIDVIAKAIASSDWNVYERLRGNDWELLPDDPLYPLLNLRPNPDMSALSFRRALMFSAIPMGNGYAEIERNATGRPVALWPIFADRVWPERDPDTREIVFRVTNSGAPDSYIQQRNMFHIPGPGILGCVGDKLISRAAASIALAVATTRFQSAYFGNNTQLGGILEYPTKLDDIAYDRLKDQWDKKHQGSKNAFKVAILESGTKFTPLNPDAQKAQMVDSRNQQIESICRWFGVPPHKIQHLVNATFNNVEHLGIEFARDGLRPWARALQQEADFKLFSTRGVPRFTRLDLEWASQGDFKTRWEGYQIGRNTGVYSANDILRKENENTIGPEGDIRYVNGAAIRLEDVGKNYNVGGDAPKALPEAQGDVVRNVFKATFTTAFQDVERRQKGREADAISHAAHPAQVIANLKKDQPRYITAKTSALCAKLREVVGFDVELLAMAAGLSVVDGKPAAQAAAEFLDVVWSKYK